MNNKYREFNTCKKLLIKISDDIPVNDTSENFQILIKFKNNQDSLWHYHIPSRAFANQRQIVQYIQENQVSDWLKMKVKRITDTLVS